MASFPVLLARRRLPAVLAVLVYGVGFLVGYLLIRGSRAWHCGPEPYCFWHLGAWETWFSAPVLPAALWKQSPQTAAGRFWRARRHFRPRGRFSLSWPKKAIAGGAIGTPRSGSLVSTQRVADAPNQARGGS
jgi:hypothetical protein